MTSAGSSIRWLYLSFFLLSCSIVGLAYAYLISDFSILSIYNSSAINTPTLYKIFGLLSTSEGSMLFFTWLLCLYRTAYATFIKIEKNIALEVQSIIYAIFLLFVIFASNPFQKNIIAIDDGAGLNPLLQDVAFAIHPPVLYIGYVGTSVIFALAIAYCYKPSFNIASAMRPWILLSWSFLTLGIGLGSWWAYRELGWGGFWFWDPVENISLIPWLLTLGLLHTTSLARKHQSVNMWLVLLGIITFTISIIDTFITRLGILESVHSFASNSGQTYYMLIITLLIIGGSIISYGIFCKNYQQAYSEHFSFSENCLLLNNFFLVTSALAIFVGIVYPLLNTTETLLITPSYYNSVLKKILLPFLCIWIIGPQITREKQIVVKNILSIVLAFTITFIFFGENFLLFFLNWWLLFSLIISYFHRVHFTSLSIYTILYQMFNLPKSYYAMFLAHLGAAILLLGVLSFSEFSIETEKYMQINDSIELKHYNLKLEKVFLLEKDNYSALSARFNINNSFYLTPEIRFYPSEGQSTAEVAIHNNLLSDLYIVISELDEKLGVGVQVHYNAYIKLIWVGVLLMFLGGIVGLINRCHAKSIVV